MTNDFQYGQRIFGRPGEIITINGLVGRFEIHAMLHVYDKETAATCPICADLGMSWGGWFSCETTGDHFAFIPTGEVFVRVTA